MKDIGKMLIKIMTLVNSGYAGLRPTLQLPIGMLSVGWLVSWYSSPSSLFQDKDQLAAVNDAGLLLSRAVVHPSSFY